MLKETDAFISLLRLGLWGNGNPDICIDGTSDWNYIYQLAQEQSVQGLILQGIEELKAKGIELYVPKILLLQWIGEVQQIELRNKEMNAFIAGLIEKLRKNDIYALLVKGQGIAQCYEKPLWRCSGDIDLFLDEENYDRAKSFLASLADSQEKELEDEKHQEFKIDSWIVEAHGNMPSRLIPYIDETLSEIQQEAFEKNQVRLWKNGDTDILLLSPDYDVIFVFTHILKHFFRGGIGLRQVCDLCRLLWMFREELDCSLLEKRLSKMKLISEWRAFAALAVDFLGMPVDAMPLYNSESKWKRKAMRIVLMIIETGNFGHNRDMSYYSKYPYVVKKVISLWRHSWDSMRHFFIFPIDSIKVWGCMIAEGVRELKKDRRS